MFSIVVSFCCLKGTIGIIPVQVRVQKMFSSLGLEIVVVSVVVCVSSTRLHNNSHSPENIMRNKIDFGPA